MIMIVIPPCFELFLQKNRQHQNIVFHSLLDCNFISLQFKKVSKCNRCHDNDNVKENCMHVSAELMVIIWIKLTFADIFKFQIKKVFNDGKMIMPRVSITWCYESVTIWVMNFPLVDCYVAFLLYWQLMKSKCKWDGSCNYGIWYELSLFFVYPRSSFQLYSPLISVTFTNFNSTNHIGKEMYC